MGAVGTLLHYTLLSNWYGFLQKIVLHGSLEIIWTKFYLQALIFQSTQSLAIEPDACYSAENECAMSLLPDFWMQCWVILGLCS